MCQYIRGTAPISVSAPRVARGRHRAAWEAQGWTNGRIFLYRQGPNQYGVFSINDSGIITGTSGSAFVRIPPSAAVGASYLFSPEWMAAADVSGVFWNNYTSGGLLDTTARNNTALSFSAGGQFIPAPNLLTPKYWETINYRAGFRYSQLPLKTSSEFALTLGRDCLSAKGAECSMLPLNSANVATPVIPVIRRIFECYSGF